MKKTENTVILVTAGTTSGLRSRQTQQSELYAQAMSQFGAVCVLDGGSGRPESLAERMDGLILSGGGDLNPILYGRRKNGCVDGMDDRRDRRELELLRCFCERKKPVLGICRGMQVIDVFFGGTLFRELRTVQLHQNTIHTVITSENGSLRELLGHRFPVNSFHHQAIRTLGQGLTVTAISEADGVIEAVEHESLPVTAVQWHAERMLSGVCEDTQTSMEPLLRRFARMIQ